MGVMKLVLVAFTLFLSACASAEYPLRHYDEVATRAATLVPEPDAATLGGRDAALVHRGQYLAQIIGCGSCHTDGALVGTPDAMRLFAGSSIGIAYTNPAVDLRPGVVFPSNLTPDRLTGIGDLSDAQIAGAIRGAWHISGAAGLMTMPWRSYAHLTDDDVQAIVAYLRSIPPIGHKVPSRVAPGTRANAPYLYFGVYRSGPALNVGH